MADNYEIVEIDVSENDILYYLVDEDDVEVGFVIEEDGKEVECYYPEFSDIEFTIAEDQTAADKARAAQAALADKEDKEEPSYLMKMATIAGHEGNKVRQKAGKQLDQVRDKATTQAKKAKEKADELDLGLSREDVSEITSSLNDLAKEGAATAKELKEAYDDIMDNVGFLIPKNVKRKLS